MDGSRSGARPSAGKPPGVGSRSPSLRRIGGEVAMLKALARDLGLSPGDARTLLSGRAPRNGGSKPRRRLLAVLERRLRECEGHLAALRSRRRTLSRAVSMCREERGGARCRLLRLLMAIPS